MGGTINQDPRVKELGKKKRQQGLLLYPYQQSTKGALRERAWEWGGREGGRERFSPTPV